MPTYSFKCPECSHKWTTFVWMKERENQVCPECGAKAEMDYSNTANSSVMIQGKGFYQERTVR